MFKFRAPAKLTRVLQIASMLALAPLACAEPDLNGLWFPGGGPGQSPKEHPFTPQAKRWSDEYLAKFKVEDDPGGWCVSPGLPRSIWGAPFPVEIVQTKDFINMFWEGYFQYRKIYMEGRPRPEPILNTRMGYSVGHWEGNTLVVETRLLSEALYGRVPRTETTVVVERFSKIKRSAVKLPNSPVATHKAIDDDVLALEITTTDPTLYSKPIKTTVYHQHLEDNAMLEYVCISDIWEQALDAANKK